VLRVTETCVTFDVAAVSIINAFFSFIALKLTVFEKLLTWTAVYDCHVAHCTHTLWCARAVSAIACHQVV
jgi:hypothetical protein